MMKFIKNLCLVVGATAWFDAQDGQHETIEAFVEKFNLDKPFSEKFLRMCICGREYQNREGYTNFDLYLPRPSKNAFPFESESVPGDTLKLQAMLQEMIKIKTLMGKSR